jgi:alpha-L-fucosidase
LTPGAGVAFTYTMSQSPRSLKTETISVRRLLLALLALLAFADPLFAADDFGLPDQDSPEAAWWRDSRTNLDERLAWFRDARFGMFIHWGVYSGLGNEFEGRKGGGYAEHIQRVLKIPIPVYRREVAGNFDPTNFDADAWVTLAKQAGMKYIVITAKHHDGFAMFDSKADPFNIVAATPFHRDPIRELAEECRKQGMKLGFYYSQDQDWTAPGGAAYKRPGHDLPTHHWDPAQDGDFATYLHTKAIPQMKELLTNYGDFPVVIWFDTPTPDMTPALAGEIVTLLNQHPNLIWNNRLGGGYKGDTETPEQFIPAQGYPGRDWEACMTMNDTWGYKSYDNNFKSTETLLRNLIDIASKGGNYLLNIGPDSKGVVPAPEVERLHQVGRWLAINGAAIYGTKATLFGAEAGSFSTTEKDKQGKPKFTPTWNWRSTTAADKIYIELFTWPAGSFHLDGVPRTVTSAYLLADPTQKPLKVTSTGTSVDIQLPAKALDPIATVLVLNTH